MKLFARHRYLGLRFVTLGLLSILLMVFNYHQHHLKSLRASLALIVTPVQYIVNSPAKMLMWAEDSMTSNQSLLEKNQELQSQLLLLKARLQKLLNLEHDNAQLRALLQSLPQPNGKVLVAKLLAVDPDPFVQQVVLNKGFKEQVYLGQPVLDSTGVFGQVIQTEPLSSRVMLITDSQSAIPVQDSRSGVRGIIQGMGEGTHLEMINMPNTADIRAGDQLVTSGLGQHFPVGYPVGKIVSITQSSGRAFAKVLVKPSAHVNRGHLVVLVWPPKVDMLRLKLVKGGHRDL